MSTLRYIFRNLFGPNPRPVEQWSTDHLEEEILPYRGRWMNDPDLWALEAIIASRKGETDRIPGLLEECRRIPGQIDEIRTAFLKEFNIDSEEWEQRIRLQDPGHKDWDSRARTWLANPGGVLTVAQVQTPHWFGGSDFRLPSCRGCLGPIRQYAYLSIQEISDLKSRLANWVALPILGCNVCTTHLFQHDYEIEIQTNEVTLVNIVVRESEIELYGEPVIFPDDDWFPVNPLPKTFAEIQKTHPILNPLPEQIEQLFMPPEETRVGGEPVWYQEASFVYCRRCRANMIHYASLASGWGPFDPPICINNDCGYHYHFACPNCHSISVIPQWT